MNEALEQLNEILEEAKRKQVIARIRNDIENLAADTNIATKYLGMDKESVEKIVKETIAEMDSHFGAMDKAEIERYMKERIANGGVPRYAI